MRDVIIGIAIVLSFGALWNPPPGTPGACSDAGAVPNDPTADSRLAFQAALDTVHCVKLARPGFYRVGVQTTASGTRTVNTIESLQVEPGHSFVCDSPAVEIRFVGDAQFEDWIGIRHIGGLVSGCTFSTAELVNTNEQTHVVQTGMRSRVPLFEGDNPTLSSNWWFHPKPLPIKRCKLNPAILCEVDADCDITTPSVGPCFMPQKGDCVRVIGQNDLPTTSAILYGNHYIDCDRSSVSIHGNVNGLAMSTETHEFAGDQWIDAETGDHVGGYWSIVGIKMRDPLNRGGVGWQLATRNEVSISGAVVDGRSVRWGGMRKLTATAVIVTSPSKGNEPVIDLAKGMTEASVDIIATRTGGPVGGNVLAATFQGTGFPSKIEVRGVYTQEKRCTLALDRSCKLDADCVINGEPVGPCTYPFETALNFSGAHDVSVDAIIEGGAVGINWSGNGRRAEGLNVGGSIFRGQWVTPIKMTPGTWGYGSVTVVGNSLAGIEPTVKRCDNAHKTCVINNDCPGAGGGTGLCVLPRGLWCSGQTSGMGPVVSAANNWGAASSCSIATAGGP